MSLLAGVATVGLSVFAGVLFADSNGATAAEKVSTCVLAGLGILVMVQAGILLTGASRFPRTRDLVGLFDFVLVLVLAAVVGDVVAVAVSLQWYLAVPVVAAVSVVLLVAGGPRRVLREPEGAERMLDPTVGGSAIHE